MAETWNHRVLIDKIIRWVFRLIVHDMREIDRCHGSSVEEEGKGDEENRRGARASIAVTPVHSPWLHLHLAQAVPEWEAPRQGSHDPGPSPALKSILWQELQVLASAWPLIPPSEDS